MFNVGGDAVREIILKWHNANENEKEKIIYAIFNNINQEYDLNVKLETVMPEGYETANGMTDVSKNKVYINLSEAKRDNTIMPLFAFGAMIKSIAMYEGYSYIGDMEDTEDINIAETDPEKRNEQLKLLNAKIPYLSYIAKGIQNEKDISKEGVKKVIRVNKNKIMRRINLLKIF